MDMEQIRDFFASSPFAWVAAGAALALLTLGGQRLFLWLRQLYRDWRERRELAIDILDIAETGTVRDVDVALERGLEINKATAHGNALHVAAGRNRNLPFLRRLLAAGVDARAQNVFGLTPLHVLARYGDIPEAVAAFVAAGADVNAAVN
ncbi:MAG: ankyrin repeat domain-containing protein, partial [Planctomycetes bacterium]|nr:ankyrin repeat domain-containing protein [Planctomycetota bacterium]